jgi:hypothetical protein
MPKPSPLFFFLASHRPGRFVHRDQLQLADNLFADVDKLYHPSGIVAREATSRDPLWLHFRRR